MAEEAATAKAPILPGPGPLPPVTHNHKKILAPQQHHRLQLMMYLIWNLVMQ